MMEYMADVFPGAFAGYKLSVTESHQRTKVDTSGTAKAIVASFEKLGAPISEVPSNLHPLPHPTFTQALRILTTFWPPSSQSRLPVFGYPNLSTHHALGAFIAFV